MSRSPSPAPAPDASSAEHDESALRRDSSESPRDTPELETTEAEAEQDSQTKTDNAASESTAPAPDTSAASTSTANAPPQGSWQAVWSPAHSAYYFYNSVTHETTWVNPLEPNAEAGPSNATASTSSLPESDQTPDASSASHDIYAAAAAQGIDPALAHLDPSLATSGATPGAFTYTAKFNSRTGAFTRPDGRDPSHLSEFERAKRMSEFYFDVNAWENDVAQRQLEEAQEEESKKRKRPTKKDLDRFKEQKRQKKLAKTAWLRS